MPQYASICLNKQGSKYATVFNIPDIVPDIPDIGIIETDMFRTFSDS